MRFLIEEKESRKDVLDKVDVLLYRKVKILFKMLRLIPSFTKRYEVSRENSDVVVYVERLDIIG